MRCDASASEFILQLHLNQVFPVAGTKAPVVSHYTAARTGQAEQSPLSDSWQEPHLSGQPWLSASPLLLELLPLNKLVSLPCLGSYQSLVGPTQEQCPALPCQLEDAVMPPHPAAGPSRPC